MIDLNKEEFATKVYTPFNGGKAGVAVNVTFDVTKKTAEDKPNAPDYKLIFIDDDGGTVNRGFWYLTDEDMAAKPKALQMHGQVMLHLWEAAGIAKVDVPSFKDTVDMLDKTMAMLRENTRFRANVAVDYGTERYHKSLLDTKFFAPFMEIDVDDTKLFLAKSSMTEPNVPTQTEALFDSDAPAMDTSKVGW